MAITKSEYLSGLGKFKVKQDAYNESIFAKKGDLVGALAYKGSVETFAELPVDNNESGDMYNVKTAGGKDCHGTSIKAGDNVIWNGDGWDDLGGEVDLSGKVDVVNGKGLSTNDFTDAYKAKLDNLTEETITQADIDKLFDAGDGE